MNDAGTETEPCAKRLSELEGTCIDVLLSVLSNKSML